VFEGWVQYNKLGLLMGTISGEGSCSSGNAVGVR